MKRLFIAIKITPTSEYLNLYNSLKRKLRFDMISWIEPNMVHLTLKFFGSTPEGKIMSICRCLENVSQSNNSFDINISNIGIFGSKYLPKVIWLGIDNTKEIINIHSSLINEISKLNYAADKGNFVPHLTIGRIKKIEDIDWFWKSINSLQEKHIQTSKVERLILYESILSNKGAKHNIIEQFDLIKK